MSNVYEHPKRTTERSFDLPENEIRSVSIYQGLPRIFDREERFDRSPFAPPKKRQVDQFSATYVNQLMDWSTTADPKDTVTIVYPPDGRISLKASEIVCLLVGYLWGMKGEPFGYAEVVDFSLNVMSKPLADGTIHNCFESLFADGLIVASDRNTITASGRRRSVFEITDEGYIAFRLAVATAKHLWTSRNSRAA